MMTKEKVIEVIKEMPQDFNLDMLIEKLIVVEKIDVAIKEVEDGKTVSHSEVKNRIEEWKK